MASGMGLKRRACVVVALLCGGGVVGLGVPAGAAAAGPVTATFSTPGSFSWTVPDGVTSVTLDVAGAQGGGPGGLGADVQGTVAVAAPETLTLTVAGQGGESGGTGQPEPGGAGGVGDGGGGGAGGQAAGGSGGAGGVGSCQIGQPTNGVTGGDGAAGTGGAGGDATSQ